MNSTLMWLLELSKFYKRRLLFALRRGGYTYFEWAGVGFQCGVCINSLPKHDFTFASHFMKMEPPKGKKPSQQHQWLSGEIPQHMRKSPPELLTGGNCVTVSQQEMETKLPSSQAEFNTISSNRSHLTRPSKYECDSNFKHHWLCNLLKITSTIDPDTLQNVPLHSCFAMDPRRRVMTRKVCKTTWEVLDGWRLWATMVTRVS
jgi:hypothetical protein